MNHRILEMVDYQLVLFLIALKKFISMPKQNCCEHPTKHANSTRVPKGLVHASSHQPMELSDNESPREDEDHG